MSKAKAAVYCGSDLAYLRLQTARLYESILVECVVFVDEKADLDNEILKSIYPETPAMWELLRCTSANICEKYDKVFSDHNLVEFIIAHQNEYYSKLVAEFEERAKTGTIFNIEGLNIK